MEKRPRGKRLKYPREGRSGGLCSAARKVVAAEILAGFLCPPGFLCEFSVSVPGMYITLSGGACHKTRERERSLV